MIERLRTRIATDLHDDIGASLTRITVFSDAVHREIATRDDKTTERITGLVSDISAISRELVDNMSDVVWSVDPRNDSFESLLLRMKTTAARVLEAKGIEFDFDIPEEVASLKLPLDFRRNFFLVFKEALNNVLRHSGAGQVRIAIGREGGWLTLTIADNGRGFQISPEGGGNGLRNMRRRAEQLSGQVHLDSTPGDGTTVRLKAKLP
jgi:signal transduction histidine kinase